MFFLAGSVMRFYFAFAVLATSILVTAMAVRAEGLASCQKKYCTQVATCAEANYLFNICGDKSLDADADGVPCEATCGKTRSEMQARIDAQPSVSGTAMSLVSQAAMSCEGKRYCKQMLTCAEARFYLKSCNVGSLDRDGDGVPCEGLCR